MGDAQLTADTLGHRGLAAVGRLHQNHRPTLPRNLQTEVIHRCLNQIWEASLLSSSGGGHRWLVRTPGCGSHAIAGVGGKR